MHHFGMAGLIGEAHFSYFDKVTSSEQQSASQAEVNAF